MTTATVTALPISRKPPQPKAKQQTNRLTKRQIKHQNMTATGLGTVTAILTGLSLSHLAHGIGIVTGAGALETVPMAIGIDLGFVLLEIAQIVGARSKFIQPTIVGLMMGSAAMNAFAFSAQSVGWMVYPAVAFGIAVPALIYSLTRVGAALLSHR
jgi:hypothetical protein